MPGERDALLVIGAGPAGCVAAGLLAQQGWPVRLLEAQTQAASQAGAAARTLALAAPSWQLLARLDIHPTALPSRPIRSIHVSYRGQAGQVCLQAAESGQDSFAHTVAYSDLLDALRSRLLMDNRVQFETGCRVTQVDASRATARVGWTDAQAKRHSLLSPLVVLADGGQSLPDRYGLSWSYRQQALSCRVGLTPGTRPADSQDRAWERFTAEGPIALLPSGDEYALIWVASPARVDSLLSLDEPAFLAALQDHFGDRAGRFCSATGRQRYPLQMRFALQAAQGRVLRVANAAQSLHPVAGQGFNLGLRDVRALCDALQHAGSSADPGAPAVLRHYRSLRGSDRWLTGGITHLLAGAFALPGAGPLVGAALTALDLGPGLRRSFARVMAQGWPAGRASQ